VNIGRRYYRWLETKALDAGKYGSMSEMKWQVLPWWLGGFGIMLAGANWPLHSAIWWAFFVVGGVIAVLGIAIVATAFISVGFNRKRLEQARQVDDD
jgi:hypothetical protein